MDSLLKRVFIRAGKHTTIHVVQPHKSVTIAGYGSGNPDGRSLDNNELL